METSDTASAVACEVVGVLPHANLFTVLAQQRVPFLSDRDSENESCPACGRRLPFTFAQSSGGGLQGTLVINHSRAEYVRACLVDGPRSRAARDYGSDEIIDAARVIGEGLD